MRNPAGTGFCCAMISFTFATALLVRLIGAFLVTSGTVVVAIRISLALKLFNYIKCIFVPTAGNQPQLWKLAPLLDAPGHSDDAFSQSCNGFRTKGYIPL